MKKIQLPRVALFDMDGTIVDTERLWAEALVLQLETRQIHLTVPRVLELMYGLAWPDAFECLRREYPLALEGMTATRLGHEMCIKFSELFTLTPPIIPSAKRLIERLHQDGVRLAVVSGSPRSTVESNLQALGMTALFDLAASVPSGEMPRGKPAPDGYLLALERLGVTANEALVFEDSRVGATAALAAGIRTFVCRAPTAPRQAYPEQAEEVTSWDEITFD